MTAAETKDKLVGKRAGDIDEFENGKMTATLGARVRRAHAQLKGDVDLSKATVSVGMLFSISQGFYDLL